MNLNFGPGF